MNAKTHLAFGEMMAEVTGLSRKFDAQNSKRLGGRVYRPIFGVKISEDHGESWKLRALCDECLASIEPPARAKQCGSAGAGNCDWCGARNEVR